MLITMSVFVTTMHATTHQEMAWMLTWGKREGKIARRGQQALLWWCQKDTQIAQKASIQKPA